MNAMPTTTTTTTRKLLPAAAALTIAAALLTPTAAHAAPDLDCDSGWIVAPSTSGVSVYDLDGKALLGVLNEPVCAVTGVVIPHPTVAAGLGSYQVEFRDQQGLVEDLHIAVFPEVAASDLTNFYVVPISDEMPGGWMDKLGSASSSIHRYPIDGGPFGESALESGIVEGTVYRSSGDPAHRTIGSSMLAGSVEWAPIEHQGSVAWMAAERLVALPDSTDRLSPFEAESAGYALYSDPTGTSAQRQVEVGESFNATRFSSGWALTSTGDWLRAPVKGAVVEAESEGRGTLENIKEKGANLWDKTKDKASDLTSTAGEKIEDAKATSKTLTLPQMVLSTVLSAIALILSVAGLLTRRARGLAAFTPAGIAKTAVAYAGAPAGLALALWSASVAPAAWVWPVYVAGGAGVLAALSLYVAASRLRGGAAHQTTDALVRGLRSPVAITGGALTGVAGIGSLFASGGGGVIAYVIAALAALAVYGGLALTARRQPDAEVTDTVNPVDPADSVPDTAEPGDVVQDQPEQPEPDTADATTDPEPALAE